MTTLVTMPFYALPGLHFEPTLADLQASSTVYVIYNFPTRFAAGFAGPLTDIFGGKVQLLA